MTWLRRPPALTFVNARVAGAGGMAETLRVSGDVVDDLDVAPQPGDHVVDLGGAFVLPGLINAHDHLELNSFRRLKWRDRYDSAVEWFADFQPRFGADPDLALATPATLGDRLWVGGLKNLLSGVTTVCHHNPLHRSLRSEFPIRVVERYRFSHSLHIDGDKVARDCAQTPREWPWIVHAAEGVDAASAREFDRLAELGCIRGNTVLVHGVGLDAASARRLIDAGGALIWCPSSNQFLFGRTADVRPFDDADRLAVGSDSRLSGEGDLLDELRVAYASRQTSAESLARAVTANAADILRLPGAGRLAPGAPADLAVIDPLEPGPFETLVASRRSDVRLTMVGGRPLVARTELGDVFAHTRTTAAPVMLDGAPRLLAAWIAGRTARSTLAEQGLEVPAA
jgi:cytosine/adenosine deaminase-related metal-dependent hydrolase